MSHVPSTQLQPWLSALPWEDLVGIVNEHRNPKDLQRPVALGHYQAACNNPETNKKQCIQQRVLFAYPNTCSSILPY